MLAVEDPFGFGVSLWVSGVVVDVYMLYILALAGKSVSWLSYVSNEVRARRIISWSMR